MKSFPILGSSLLLLGFSTLYLLGLGSCSKDKSPTGTDTSAKGTEVTSLFGRIGDDTGGALAGVIVTSGTWADTTDANGFFSLADVTVPKGRAVVLAKKPGYFNGARAEVPGSDGTTRILLRLGKKTTYTVSASAGGNVDVAGGAKIGFPAGGFVTKSGAAYTGPVTVAANYLDPNSPDFYYFFSGDNAGMGADGQEAALISVGVIRAELEGSGGEALQLATGKTATLSFPKPSGMAPPDTMPLWYFDEESGMWTEQGQATLTAAGYVGTVTHFSVWNCDYKGKYTGTLDIRVFCDTLPIGGVIVRFLQHLAMTDRDGTLRFVRTPADVGSMKVEILASDNGGRYFLNSAATINIKPNETVSQVYKLDSHCPTSIHGALVNCNGDSIQGLTTATYGKEVIYDYTRKGDFFLRVPSQTALTFTGTDDAGNKVDPPLAVSPLHDGEQRDLGPQRICGTKTLGIHELTYDSMVTINSFALSADGKLAAAIGNPKDVVIWDVASGKVIKEIPVPSGASNGFMKFSDDDTRLMVNTYPANTVVIWDISGATAKALASFPSLTWAELSDDGKTVLGAKSGVLSKLTLFSADDGSEIKTLNPAEFSAPWEFQGVPHVHRRDAENAFVYLTTKAEATYRVWSIAGDSLMRDIPIGQPVEISFNYIIRPDMEFSRDGDLVAASTDYKITHIFSLVTGQEVAVIDPTKFGADAGSAVAGLSPHYALVVVNIAGSMVVQQFALSDTSLVKVHPTPVRTDRGPRVAFPKISRDEKIFIAENYDRLRVWPMK